MCSYGVVIKVNVTVTLVTSFALGMLGILLLFR